MTDLSVLASGTRRAGLRWVGVAGLAALCCFVLPVVPFFVGGSLVVGVLVHAFSPTARPFVEPLLRLPIAAPARRRRQLLLEAGAGVLLVLGASTGAGLNGRVRGELEQRGRMNALAEQQVEGLLERAREHLDEGRFGEAELVLLNAVEVRGVDPDRRAEVDELLDRVRRSGDPEAILAILVDLSPAEFDAFERGESVPHALGFGHRGLDWQAARLARTQLDEARRAREGR
jgi:hypothetical protein